jgi:hypothetical protein
MNYVTRIKRQKNGVFIKVHNIGHDGDALPENFLRTFAPLNQICFSLMSIQV